MSWGMWAKYEYSSFSSDFVSTAFDADRHSLLAGADFSPFDSFVAGVALGYADTNMDTTFNGGDADLEELTVVPYLAFLLNDYVGVSYDLSVDLMVGYTNVDIDQNRTVAGARVTSSTSSDRLFFSSNFNAAHTLGDLLLSGRFGWLVARDEIDGFTESNGNVVAPGRVAFGQLNAGAEAAYLLGVFEPYAMFSYEYDYDLERVVATPQPDNDKDQFRVGAGFRVFSNEWWSAGFQWDRTFGRSNFDEDNFSVQFHATY